MRGPTSPRSTGSQVAGRKACGSGAQDVRDAQADDGRFPDVAPHPYGKNQQFTGAPGWGDAGVVVGDGAFGEDVGQEHVVDDRDVADVPVLVGGVGVEAAGPARRQQEVISAGGQASGNGKGDFRPGTDDQCGRR